MDALYQEHQMQGLSKEAFADKLVDMLAIDMDGIEDLQSKIPRTGPVVIASNHPFGGIEGVILARAISQIRPDLKTFANKGLKIFQELQDYFIFTNPLSEKDPANGPSIRHCIKHVEAGKALLLFPAGRVSYYQADKKRISEHTWNKIVGRLTSIDNCQLVSVFVYGKNSPWFYRLGRIYYRLRMLMLARELLNKNGAKIKISASYPIPGKLVKGDSHQDKADICRVLSYAQDACWRYNWPADKKTTHKALIPAIKNDLIKAEIANIASEQKLLEQGEFSVYYGYQNQCPNIVLEIARLRELVFREHNEGSGEPLDTDEFDASYTHLFIINKDSQIIGAYRMGQTDRLLQQGGLQALYLNKMFEFSPSFVNQNEACLELGRSFLIPEFQGSYQGLLLLWRGICAFAFKYPQYRTLYGTVSISKLYDPRSVRLIQDNLITKEDTLFVSPRHSFGFASHNEILEMQNSTNLKPNLSSFLKGFEKDGKDIPILAKQYLKMGARFHALGIDTSFNHTPGLLLSVHLPNSPDKLLKLYMGKSFQEYRNYSSP